MRLKKRTFLLIIFSTAFILAVVVFCPLFPLFMSNTANAADVTLAWDANSESNLAGYKLYYESDIDDKFYGGTDANEGDSPITIFLVNLIDPDSPSYTITGLESGAYYYFALTAFDSNGIESAFSDEAGATVSDSGGGSGCFISDAMNNNNSVPPMTIFGSIIILCVAVIFPVSCLLRICQRLCGFRLKLLEGGTEVCSVLDHSYLSSECKKMDQ